MLIRPRAPHAAANQLEKMLPFLNDIADEAFDPQLLPAVAKRLKRTPMLADVRLALEETLDPPDPAPPVVRPAVAAVLATAEDAIAKRAALEDQLRADWSVAGHVRQSVANCEDSPFRLLLLGVLRGAVSRYAPHNLDLIPPPLG
jgi:hypothetical protein